MLVLAPRCILVQIFVGLGHFCADILDMQVQKRERYYCSSRLFKLAQHCRLPFSKQKDKKKGMWWITRLVEQKKHEREESKTEIVAVSTEHSAMFSDLQTDFHKTSAAQISNIRDTPQAAQTFDSATAGLLIKLLVSWLRWHKIQSFITAVHCRSELELT